MKKYLLFFLLFIGLLFSCSTSPTTKYENVGWLPIKIKHWEKNEIPDVGNFIFRFYEADTLKPVLENIVISANERIHIFTLPAGAYLIEYKYVGVGSKIMDVYSFEVTIESNKINIPDIGIDIDYLFCRDKSILAAVRNYPLSENEIVEIKQYVRDHAALLSSIDFVMVSAE